MATSNEVRDAISRVRSGNANQRDHDLTDARANSTDDLGSRARAAQKADGKPKPAQTWI